MATSDETGELVILEDLSPKKTWKKKFEYPYNTLLHEVIGIFRGCSVVCNIKVDNETQTWVLKSGAPEFIELDVMADEFEVVLDVDGIEEDALISYMGISLITLGPVPVRSSDVKLLTHPEHGKTVMFDMADALEIASGNETAVSKEAQIRAPDNTIFNIKVSTPNFMWRGNKLYCDIPTGHTYYFRMKYNTEDKEIGWSDWLKFLLRRARTAL